MASKKPLRGSVWMTVYDLTLPDFAQFKNGADGVRTCRFPVKFKLSAGDSVTVKGTVGSSPVRYGDFVRVNHQGVERKIDLQDFNRSFINFGNPDVVDFVVYSAESGRYVRLIAPDRTDYTTLKCAKKNKALEYSVDWLNGCSGFYRNGDYFYKYPSDRKEFDIPDDIEIRKVVNGEVVESHPFAPIRADWNRYRAVYERYGIFVAKVTKAGQLPPVGFLRVDNRSIKAEHRKRFKGLLLNIPQKYETLISFDKIDDILYYCFELDCKPADVILTEDIQALVT